MDIRYLAGFFDGEGTIRIKKRKKRPNGLLQIQICQKRPEVLSIIKDEFGGWVEKAGNVRHWVITDKGARDISKKMLPYLVVKKDEVKKLLDLY